MTAVPKVTSTQEKKSLADVTNYVTNNRFYIEIDRQTVARFAECSEISVQIKKDTYFEGGVNDQQRIILDRAEFSDITLKRGITNSPAFFEWLGASVTEQKSQSSSRHNVNILLHNQAGEIMLSWGLIGSVPVSWKTSVLKAHGNCVAMEELTLAFEGLQIGRSSGGGAIQNHRRNDGFFDYSKWKLEE